MRCDGHWRKPKEGREEEQSDVGKGEASRGGEEAAQVSGELRRLNILPGSLTGHRKLPLPHTGYL